jgi:hypothetical protein
MAIIPTITTIQKTECIGNSLVTLTNNFDNIRNSFTSVNTNIATINNILTNLTTFANSISSAQLAKAWVSFSGLVAPPGLPLTSQQRLLNNSYNINEVLRESTGIFLIKFNTPIGNNFIVTGMTSPLPGSLTEVSNFTGTGLGVINLHPTLAIPDSQSCRIIVRDLVGNAINPNTVHLTFYNN